MRHRLVAALVAVGSAAALQGSDERPATKGAASPAPARAAAPDGPTPAPIFNDLRAKALAFRVPPGTPRIAGSAGVHSLIADWTVEPGTTVTVVAAADGAASIYFPGGGGVIGAGEHEPVRREVRRVLDAAAGVRHLLRPGEHDGPPAPGRMRMMLVTDAGVLVGEDSGEAMQDGHSPLSELGNAVQRLITAIRVRADGRP